MRHPSTWKRREYYLENNHITYYEYLQSEHWQDVKKRKLESKAKYKCYICGINQYLELHHRTYKRMGHEWLKDVIWLCRNCHQSTHDFVNINKNTSTNLWNGARKLRYKRCKKLGVSRRTVA